MLQSADTILDLYELDAEYSEEQRAIVDQVRRFVNNEVLPCIGEHHNNETFPEEILPTLKQLGLLEAVASGDMDPITYGLINRELERGSSALRSILSVQGSLVMGAVSMFGSDEHKKTWLPELGTFDKWGCFGLTEPDFGSNPSGMLTRAEKVSGGYKLNGAKSWITNATKADMAVVWAKLDGKVRGFVVETDRKGFEAKDIKGKWSFRASCTGQLFMDNVEVPESALMEKSTSVGSALKCLNQARYSIVWGVVGAARGCLEETVTYLKERVQFDNKPLASHQLIQNKFAWMAAEITGMELIAKRLSELKAKDQVKPVHVSLAKMNNCRKAIEVARTCRELMGANGIHNEYHIGRRMVDLETVLTYEGTEHIHSLIVGQHLTGIAAYS